MAATQISRKPLLDHQRLAQIFLLTLAGMAVFCSATGTSTAALKLAPCPFRAVTDLPCPGCGITRGCVALALGDVESAWTFHPFAFLLVGLSLLAALIPRKTRKAWLRVYLPVRVSLLSLAIGMSLLLWVFRMG